MNDAANQKALARLLISVREEPQTLEELWQAQPMLWQDLGWEQSQLLLWLYCQPGLVRDTNSNGVERYALADINAQDEPDLSQEIAKIVQSNGRPLPLAQLKSRLPSGLLATEPMLRAAIAEHPNLQMVGPMVKLI
ncbi:hypothetical protein [Parahaliea mediterranea]|uniref:hypothetical protein n=1 Tax=Parahaliea mediterranea TaxID=651086 RepID=UPI000E2EBD99|nr:hypothetical protein [Parahaliea mediterranea]